jgi:hypothetical protein
VGTFRDEVIENIEVALVELKGIAQPRDLAELGELLLDAKDAHDAEQLQRIHEQAKSLRAFCEKRHTSSSGLRPQK